MRAVQGARPYWFELFTVANLIAIGIAVRPLGISVVSTLPASFVSYGITVVVQLLLGALIHLALSGRSYLRAIGNAGWAWDTVRIAIASVLWVHTYAWIKLTIPLLHRRLFDPELNDMSRAMFFHHSPNVFLLELFSRSIVLRVFDWMYAYVFFGSLFIAATYFLSTPDRALRVRFTNANSTMWLVGAWIYVALPSLGPAYFFPDVWQPLAASLDHTQTFQRLLMTNYQIVVHFALRQKPINLLFGIAAFPSLHVAFETLVLLFMVRLSRVGRLVYVVAFIFIFIGSMVTGWHYLIDALAGIVLAVVAWTAFQRPLPRFMRHATTE